MTLKAGVGREAHKAIYCCLHSRRFNFPLASQILFNRQRTRLPDLVFGTADEKWHAIVQEIRDLHLEGRPILVGTRSIDKSIILSRLLNLAGIEHKVLNAHEIATEAEIVKLAGQPDLYRIRVGDYRIVYQLRNQALTVLVVSIGHRKDIYRK